MLIYSALIIFNVLKAAMGGLLGLGLGVSFISVIEVIVYLMKTLIRFIFLSACSDDKNTDEKIETPHNEDKSKWPSNSTIFTNDSVTSSPSEVALGTLC